MKKSLLTRGCTAATTLALAASLVPTPALAEATDAASGNQDASEATEETTTNQATSDSQTPASQDKAPEDAAAANTGNGDATSAKGAQNGAATASGTKADTTGSGAGNAAASSTAVTAKAKAAAPSATPAAQTVKLDANGGTVATASVAAGSPLPGATREGYAFLGWTLSQRAAIESTTDKQSFTVDWWEGDKAPALGEKPESINYTTGSTGTLYALWAKDGVWATVTKKILWYTFTADLDKPQTGTMDGDIAAKVPGSDKFDTQSGEALTVDGKSTVTLRSYLDTTTVKDQLKSATGYLSFIQGATDTFQNPTEVMLRDLKSNFTVSYVLDGLANPTNYSVRELTDGTLSDSTLYELGTPTLAKDETTGTYTITVPLVLKGDYPTFDALQKAVSAVGNDLVLDLDATVGNVTATHTIRGTVGGSMTAVAVFSRGKAFEADGVTPYWTYKYALPYSFTWTGVQGNFPESADNQSGADGTLEKGDDDSTLPIQLTFSSVYVADPTPEPEPEAKAEPEAKPAAAPAKAAPAKQAKPVTKATKTAVPQTGDEATSPVPALAGAVAALAAALGISRRRREE